MVNDMISSPSSTAHAVEPVKEADVGFLTGSVFATVCPLNEHAVLMYPILKQEASHCPGSLGMESLCSDTGSPSRSRLCRPHSAAALGVRNVDTIGVFTTATSCEVTPCDATCPVSPSPTGTLKARLEYVDISRNELRA